jgi:hypothetical protein
VGLLIVILHKFPDPIIGGFLMKRIMVILPLATISAVSLLLAQVTLEVPSAHLSKTLSLDVDTVSNLFAFNPDTGFYL